MKINLKFWRIMQKCRHDGKLITLDEITFAPPHCSYNTMFYVFLCSKCRYIFTMPVDNFILWKRMTGSWRKKRKNWIQKAEKLLAPG